MASCSSDFSAVSEGCLSPECCVDVPDTPHQPDASFAFPKRAFGKTKVAERSFQSSWFRSWTWLHYCESKDSVVCHLCCRAMKEKHITSKPGAADAAFVSFTIVLISTVTNVFNYIQLTRGFTNWKDATISFRKHERAHCHKIAVEKLVSDASYELHQ